MSRSLCIFFTVLLAGCITHPELLQECKTGADCVAAECCHATSCMPTKDKPDCKTIACTLECAPDTMDCGRGYCDCIAGKCTSVQQKGESGQ